MCVRAGVKLQPKPAIDGFFPGTVGGSAVGRISNRLVTGHPVLAVIRAVTLLRLLDAPLVSGAAELVNSTFNVFVVAINFIRCVAAVVVMVTNISVSVTFQN